MNFTAHSILLRDGTKTIPGAQLLSENEQCKAFMRILNETFRPEERGKTRIVDLGCLEGGYCIEFARNGYQCLGIEARQQAIDKCEYAKANCELQGVTFVKDDVKNIRKYGTFDVVFCCGLLYHLDKPVEFVRTLGSLTKKMLIVHTHYSVYPDMLYDLDLPRWKRLILQKILGPSFNVNKCDYSLSPITTNEGKLGRWYKEYEIDETRDQIEAKAWAAYSNPRSFWLTKEALIETIRESGFKLVLEQFDFVNNLEINDAIKRHDRSLFIGIK